MTNWQSRFDVATEVYTRCLLSGALLSGAERAASAREFRGWIDIFKSGGEEARAILEDRLQDENYNRCTTAARLFIECGDADSLARLSQNVISFRGKITWQDLKRLWVKVPPSKTLYDEFTQNNAYERTPLLQALLHRPTPAAYDLFREITEGRDWYGTQAQTVEALAKWNDLPLLREFMNMFVDRDNTLAYGNGRDVRTIAAFYLGLGGERDGIEFLKNEAGSANSAQATEACYYLEQLALPDAIEPTIRLFSRADGDTIARAMNIASDLGLPEFIPIFCNIADRKKTSPTYDSETPMYDEAIRAVRNIVGKPIEDLDEEFVDPRDNPEPEIYGEGEFSEAYRRKAIAIAQNAMKAMNPVSRYRRGALLTLEHLATDLLSPHSGPMYRAAYHLRAITGEDYGFDVDDDLIANLPAIEAWQKRANRPEPLVPGGWAYFGTPLPYPKLK